MRATTGSRRVARVHIVAGRRLYEKLARGQDVRVVDVVRVCRVFPPPPPRAPNRSTSVAAADVSLVPLRHCAVEAHHQPMAVDLSPPRCERSNPPLDPTIPTVDDSADRRFSSRYPSPDKSVMPTTLGALPTPPTRSGAIGITRVFLNVTRHISSGFARTRGSASAYRYTQSATGPAHGMKGAKIQEAVQPERWPPPLRFTLSIQTAEFLGGYAMSDNDDDEMTTSRFGHHLPCALQLNMGIVVVCVTYGRCVQHTETRMRAALHTFDRLS